MRSSIEENKVKKAEDFNIVFEQYDINLMIKTLSLISSQFSEQVKKLSEDFDYNVGWISDIITQLYCRLLVDELLKKAFDESKTLPNMKNEGNEKTEVELSEKPISQQEIKQLMLQAVLKEWVSSENKEKTIENAKNSEEFLELLTADSSFRNRSSTVEAYLQETKMFVNNEEDFKDLTALYNDPQEIARYLGKKGSIIETIKEKITENIKSDQKDLIDSIAEIKPINFPLVNKNRKISDITQKDIDNIVAFMKTGKMPKVKKSNELNSITFFGDTGNSEDPNAREGKSDNRTSCLIM